MATREVLVTTGRPGWHGERLARAFAAHGYRTVFADLAACRVDAPGSAHGFVVPGLEGRLPALVVVREIAAGTFEQVTLRLGLLHAFAHWNVPVANTATAVERTVDKSMTTMLLHKAGLASPPTWVTEREEDARAIVARETSAGHRIVSKPLFGSQGKGLRLAGTPAALPAAPECQGVFYLQRFVESAEDCDYRVFVIGGRAVAAMRRRGPTWIHNVAQGARCERCEPADDLAAPAIAAARAVGAVYAGVDLIRGRDGEVLILEVNGIPAWQGLQAVCDTDIAAALASHLVSLVQAPSS